MAHSLDDPDAAATVVSPDEGDIWPGASTPGWDALDEAGWESFPASDSPACSSPAKGPEAPPQAQTVTSKPVLRVSGLKVTFEGRIVISDLSFSVKPGEVLTILGPNGAGKTILLRALLGTVLHEGTIAWRRGVRIGYVPQRPPDVSGLPLSVANFFALKRGGTAPAGEMLGAVGLDPALASKRMGKLSAGQFQRVLVAWALAGDPNVLVFDEPTTGVDLGGEETVYALLTRLHRQRNLSMLIVTHDLAVVHKLSTTVLCLNRSQICHGPPLAALTPENLRRLYGTEVRSYQHTHE